MPYERPSDLLTVALVVGDPNLSEEIRSCIHEVPVHIAFETPMLRPRQELVSRIQAAGTQVVLLDLDAAGEAVDAAIRDIKSALPNCHILAVGKAVEAEAILGAFRAGCSDYLCPPLKRGLIAALGRISHDLRKERQRAAVPGGSILGFLSAKGGCGATTIACHVAAELRRLTSEKMLLADMDLTSGVVSFLMKAERRHNILDAISNTNRLDASYWSALVSDCSGLDVVAAPPPASQAPPAASVSETMRFLRSQYRFVLADLGRGVNPFIEAAVDEIDRVFVVTTAERPALHQARQMAEYFTEKRSPRVDVRLILNRLSQDSRQLSAADCRDLVGLPVCCEISNDNRELYDALVAGKLVPPKSRLGKQFTQAARAIARISDGEQRRASFSLTPGWLKAAADFLR
jgi:pilus assembly protein CpaE